MVEYFSNLSLIAMILSCIGALVVLAILIFVLTRLFSARARGRKGHRLSISEYCELDQSRRLVLIRRDHVEHLVLIGGGQDVVIESRIDTSAEMNSASFGDAQDEPIVQAQPTRSKHRTVVPMRPPREPVFGNNRPVMHAVEDERNS